MAIATIIDSAVLIAFFALSVDIIIQIIHITKRRSSKDVSLNGSLIRLVAVTIFLIKFVIAKDPVLIIGQAVFVSAFAIYFILLAYFRK